MFKLNKFLHILILMTFTIVFMVVYLYYIVRDMKRMYQDSKKQATDLQNLQAMVNEIKGVVEMALCATAVPPAKTEPVITTTTESIPAEINISEAQTQPQPIASSDVPSENVPNAFDAESVESEDIRKLVEEGEVEEEIEEAAPLPTKEDVMNMKYEQLKEFCKKNNMSIKGSRDALINKILTEKNIN
jgi:hypothetical protein